MSRQEPPATRMRVGLPEDGAAKAALAVVSGLRRAGFSAYLVGGCVRDLVLGRPPKDWDVATAAEPGEVRAVFGCVIEVGVAFGVVRVPQRVDGERHEIEVATFRAESGYADGRRPDEVRFTDARQDVRRRDFTINGLLLHPDGDGAAGAVVDFVGGLADLRAGVLRAIGDPAERFAEDHLRILRAARFASRFELRVDPATMAAARAAAGQLTRISAERVRDELLRMLVHPRAPRALALLADLRVPALLWPPLAGDPDLKLARRRFTVALHELRRPPPVDPEGFEVCDRVSTELALGLLFRPEAAPDPRRAARRVGALLKLSGAEVAATARLAQLAAALLAGPPRPIDRIRLLREELGDAALVLALAAGQDATRVRAARRERAATPRRRWCPDPTVTGHTLVARGHAPGKAFREALRAAEEVQLDGGDAELALAAAERVLSRGG